MLTSYYYTASWLDVSVITAINASISPHFYPLDNSFEDFPNGFVFVYQKKNMVMCAPKLIILISGLVAILILIISKGQYRNNINYLIPKNESIKNIIDSHFYTRKGISESRVLFIYTRRK